jgi:AraC-like DNA-binding protein
MMCFLQHRIADRRVLALLVRWLRTGVLENGKRTPAKQGTPQGALISPLLANIYLRLRLEKARQLLRQTDMSVLEVSIACGFESPSYFTRSYRAKYERCPREDRRTAKA